MKLLSFFVLAFWAFFAIPLSASPLLDVVTVGDSNSGDVTVAHTTGNGADRLMMVGISWKKDSNKNFNSVTYGGVDLVELAHISGNDQRVAIFYLKNPTTELANVVVDFKKSHKGAVVGVSTYTNVDQTTPLGPYNSETGDGTALLVDVVSVASDLVYDVLTNEKDASSSVGAGQSELWNSNANINEIRGAGSSELAAGATTEMSWSLSTQKKWLVVGVAIKSANPSRVTMSRVELTALPVTEYLDKINAMNIDSKDLSTLFAGCELGRSVELSLQMLIQCADPDGDGLVAVIGWETLEELGTIGFYVERRELSKSKIDWVYVNKRMLPGLITAPMGAEYQLIDIIAESGTSYEYRIIEIEARGTQNIYGPYQLKMD